MTTARRVTSGDGFVFLIASHKNPTQVVRLAHRIARDLPQATLVLHHDRSQSNIDVAELPTERTHVIDDYVSATWGTARQVEATTRGLERIERDVPDFRWVFFISGQDYPIRHLGTLADAFAESSDGYVDVEPPGRDEPLRYELGWFRLPDALQTARTRRIFESLIYHCNDRQRIVRFASGRLGCTVGARVPSPIPRGWRVYQGSNWWTLSRKAVLQYLTYKRERPALYRWFMERTIVPDEGIFQTLLLNTPGLKLDGPDIRYIRWDDRNSGSPAIFTQADFAELRGSGRFFARKFDIDVDTTILDALDAAADDDI
jgi:hypothetical protein